MKRKVARLFLGNTHGHSRLGAMNTVQIAAKLGIGEPEAIRLLHAAKQEAADRDITLRKYVGWVA